MKWRSIILSSYGVIALIFLLASLITLLVGSVIASVFLTAFSLIILDMVRIHYQKPKIFISKIDRHKLTDSIRIYAKIENKGRSVAKYVKPLLTIEDENLTQLVYARLCKLKHF